MKCTYAGEAAVGEAGAASPADILRREGAGPLALEEDDGFSKGISVIRVALDAEERDIEEDD